MISTKSPRNSPSQGGFALIVTLSLMILLTVIAVGLLSLSSIALRSSSQGDAAAAARTNARLALMLAISELQKELGPDSRISAPHDAGTTPSGGKPRWTAVYDAWKTDTTNPSGALTPSSRMPNFRTWLVSGAIGTNVSANEVVSLVGPGSLGSNYMPADLVSAPLVELSDSKRKGKIAWWTADENAKAKITAGALSDNFPVVANPLSDVQAPPRTGPQALPLLSGFEWKPNQRSAAISTASVNLAAKLNVPGIGNLSHDITVHSAGVLSDVREGRLKRDLTNLLTRPISEVEDKPLYLADGRMNRFVIGADGSVSKGQGIPNNSRTFNSSTKAIQSTAADWGINMEELFLFHNLHREIQWSGKNPKLVSKSSREAAVNDRYYIYRKPTIEAAQFIFSLKASPDTAAGRYKMQMMLDGMVSVSNPNDITFEYAPGLQLAFQLFRIPYSLKWNIRSNTGAVKNNKTAAGVDKALQQFKGYVGGGPAAADATGFSLLPGEAGVFGSSTGTGAVLNLKRGFVPSGGVLMNADLLATNLLSDDQIDFQMDRWTGTNPNYPDVGSGNSWVYCNYWLGPRDFGGKQGWHMGAFVPYPAPLATDTFLNQFLPLRINPSETDRKVSQFISKPQPILTLSYLRNVEQSTSGPPPNMAPDAFASRQFLMNESASSMFELSLANQFQNSLHKSQLIVKAESANYTFNSLASGSGGSNIYHGGGRLGSASRGDTFFVIKRRVPLSPPLSLGAFENAIATGCALRWKDARVIGDMTDTLPTAARALTGEWPATPVVAKAIGNSYASPFLAPHEVYRAVNPQAGGTDHSWMVNNALWDSWFLSGIVDGRGAGNNPFQTDSRSPRAQFDDLANGTGLLRNPRFLFNPSRTADSALLELFSGDILKPSAINDLSKFLLIDGAFNVNSTSKIAWKSLLSSLHRQELIVNGGTKEPFGNPYGTLGYAQDKSSTNDWSGLRDLSDADIEALANAIVIEVKARGPFLNLSDFVNRRPNSTDASHQALGALQAAIDKSGLNNRFTSSGRGLSATDFSLLPGASAIATEPAPARAAGSAGHLTQARLLTALGTQITVRSDSFIIRTYGDARDATGKILSKAWCEAVVQRMPEYVDPTDRPEAAEGWPGSSDTLTATNSRFGRRFEIRSFRWMSSNEI